jgi:exo-beta-1,3-glucanase (GH17 family)
MSYKSKAHLYLIISLVIGICLSVVLLLDLSFSQAATPESASLAPIYTIELVPDQMTLTGDVATRDNCTHTIVCSWLEDTPTGTIILGVDPTSPDPLTWDGGSATAEIPLTDFYSPMVLVLKLSWPDRDGKGLRSLERNRIGAITLDGRPLWGKRTIHLSTFGDYYAAEHEPILTTIVLTQSITHTLSFSVSARMAWDLSRIELSAYPYPTTTIKGIGYSPYRDCQYPGGELQPSIQDMQEDLFRLLHTTNAIRTYAARGVNGQIPALANAIGLPVFAGAWLDADPQGAPMVEENDAEIEALIDLACTTNLEGGIVGSEYYLRSERTEADTTYLLQRIREVKDGVRERCGKELLVTTAEVDDLIFEWESRDAVVPRRVNPHFDEILEEVDFVMVHIYPFWYGLPIDGAAAFTVKRYKAIQDLIERDYFGKRVIIGEVGWPSAGAPNYGEEPYDGADLPTDREPAVPSLENQRCYMLEFLWLAEKEGVEYMYFDAFDELWKIEERGRVGQNWGYSYTDRTAKHNFYGVLLPAEGLFPYEVYLPYIARQSASSVSHLLSDVELTNTSPQSLIQASSSITFPVFTEWPMGPDDHFVPSGWMGITETLDLYECDRANPHSGEMAIRASFSPTDTDSWGGIYWQHPENNWGDVEEAGINLDDATYLRFYARGEEGGEQVKFLMGGIWGEYPDSQQPALSTDVITLTQEWLTYTIDLRGRDLSRVVGGFAFVADDCLNPEPITFYLDDIEYMLEGDPGAPTPTPTPETPYTFDVYRDRDIAGNHYVPSGWMGDTGDIRLDECWRGDTHTGSTAIRVEYTAEGEEPYECGGLSPCNWAGVYWQDPADNWGDRPGGYDLTGARALTFWAKGKEGGEWISFKVGGIGCGSSAYPDSLCPVQALDPAPIDLTTTWGVYTIPLSADLVLSSVVGGFLWAASSEDNPDGATFYLDDIQYLFNVDIPLQPHSIYYGPRLADGYDMGVNTSEGLTDWLTDMGGYMRMDYPSGQSWGAVFVTVGPPTDPPRPGKDLSNYRALSLELRGEVGGEDVWVGLKDNTDRDDGSERKIRVRDLTKDWQTFNFPLSAFVTADLTRLYVVTEFVFEPGTPAETVYFRRIRYLP